METGTKMAVDLRVARHQLVEALGDNAQTYWNNMKLWYKQKISKEEFDAQAKKCLGNDNIRFHNEFLLAILAKCQALGSTPAAHPRTPQKLPSKPQLIKKGKIRKHKQNLKANFEQRFSPYDPLQDVPPLSLKTELSEDSEIGLCSYDMMLPDSPTIHGRLFLGAWDTGLDSVADETVTLMLYATEYLMKDILTVCCALRSAFRLKDGHFRYAMGTSYPRIHLRNSTSPWPPDSERSFVPGCSTASNSGRTLEQAEAEGAVTVASSDTRPLGTRPPISLMDLRDSLQIHRRVIPSHTVFSANLERILANMYHPSNDELQQNQLHKLEARRRYERLKQQRSLRL